MTEQNNDDVIEDVQTRPFADLLLDLNKGRTHAELSSALQKLVAAVADTGKKGSLALTVVVSPSKSEAPFEIVDNVVIKMPAANRRASLFYADDDFNLTRTDPHQPQLPLRDITADKPRKAN
jgi:hypothetical protein